MSHPADHHEKHDARIAREAEEITAVEDRLEAFAGRSGVASLMSGDRLTPADLLRVLGGVRGLIETLLPGIVFVAAYAIGQVLQLETQRNLLISLGLSLGLSVVFVGVRMLQRSQARSATAGLIAASASAAIALLTGSPQDNYLLSIIINAVYGGAMLLSVLVGWPIVGLFMGFLMGDGLNWRTDRNRFRVMVWLTLMWAGVFALRLAVQVPLYFAGEVVALGIARLALGTPLYALFLVITWLVTRALYPKSQEHTE